MKNCTESKRANVDPEVDHQCILQLIPRATKAGEQMHRVRKNMSGLKNTKEKERNGKTEENWGLKLIPFSFSPFLISFSKKEATPSTQMNLCFSHL
jgi:hypothetical protein